MEMRSKFIILISVTLVWVLGAVQGFHYEDHEVETEAGRRGMYERWRSHHNMQKISDSKKEEEFKVFKSTLELVHKTNKMNKPYKLKMNKFAGMSKEERVGMLGAKAYTPSKIKQSKHYRSGDPFMYENVTDIPPKMDWRTLNAVTPVKMQANCGSCYAFAGCDAVEGLHAIKNKELIELSPKEIVDCAGIGGCGGGTMQHCYEYIEKNGGLTTMKNYPYSPQVDTCTLDKEKDIVVHIHGHQNVPRDDEDALLKAAANQPISVCIEVNDEFWVYEEGLLNSPCGNKIMHAVLVVGYDEMPDGTKYWIIKNSWDKDWGDEGYIKMVRGQGGKGYCGIAQQCSYPTLKDTGTKHHDCEEPVQMKDL